MEQKLIAEQLLNKFPDFLWKTKIYYRFYENPPLYYTLIQISVVHNLPHSVYTF